MTCDVGPMAPMQLLLLLPLLAPLVAAQEGAREQIKPSLECSCSSTRSGQDAVDLDCQRIVHGWDNVSVGDSTRSSFSCAYGTGGSGSLDGDWRAAEAPGVGVFLLNTREASWDEARAACGRRGQLLAPMAGGKSEAQAALKALGATGSQLFWVGVRYYEDVRGFYTTRGQPMVDMEWPKGQPNIRKGSNCPALGGDAKLRGPYACSGKRNFICKP